ncbi:histidine phosphatase family protein [Mycolicibacterium phlei]|uniref:histidine phosphatase family protein n=1 Tax=Mycolicibacterium phlei TaxID=1771 RepID=UPI0037C84447
MSGRLVLLRHGQSLANVERRLDTRPPGAPLSDLGRNQARAFARELPRPPALLAHSIAHRARQTAEEIAGTVRVEPLEVDGIHEVQVGELEDRSDDDAVAEFEAVYKRWHLGELDVAMPNGETGREVLDRYVPTIAELRARHLDDDSWRADIVVVSHGAAIRLVSSVLAGVDPTFALGNHLSNTEAVVLAPITDGRWSCLQWGSLTPPFHPDPGVRPIEDAVNSADPMG